MFIQLFFSLKTQWIQQINMTIIAVLFFPLFLENNIY